MKICPVVIKLLAIFYLLVVLSLNILIMLNTGSESVVGYGWLLILVCLPVSYPFLDFLDFLFAALHISRPGIVIQFLMSLVGIFQWPLYWWFFQKMKSIMKFRK